MPEAGLFLAAPPRQLSEIHEPAVWRLSLPFDWASAAAQARKSMSGRCRVGGRLVERGRPGIVAIQPARVAASFAHPRVGAGDGLNDRGARLAVRFVTLKGAFDVVATGRLKTAREHCGVLNRGGSALRHVGCHRMAG